MINVEQAIHSKFPSFASKPKMLRNPTLTLLKKLVHETEINAFLRDNNDARGFDFIDRVFSYFNFSYRVDAREQRRILKAGRLIIIANHPIGSLDGLALLRMVGEVRRDVKVIANDMLMNFEPLHELFIPLDNMTGGSTRKSYKNVIKALEDEQAVIVFPAGEVSRARPSGVKDTRWRPGFLHFSRKTSAPVLPVHINAKNSLFFYAASLLFKPLGTALLAHEMFNKRSANIALTVGELIPSNRLSSKTVQDRALVKRVKRHIYRLGQQKVSAFVSELPLASAQPPKKLFTELQNNKLIGETRDGNQIYLVDCAKKSAVLKEIGRLRELAFRMAGEGTGKKRDIDSYDLHYRHLVLWNAKNQEIAGAYRIGEGKNILANFGEEGLYTRSLYKFKPELAPYFEQGIELGRSFVSPKYWGKACLDYLWQGLGAYIAHNPDVRYLIGPVSMSADYPRQLMNTLVYFYRRYYACEQQLAEANHPYLISTDTLDELDQLFGPADASEAFDLMQEKFNAGGHKLPVLFKQYAALYEPGGFKSIVFSRDPDFGDCLDGLCMADVWSLKENKRKRYIPKL